MNDSQIRLLEHILNEVVSRGHICAVPFLRGGYSGYDDCQSPFRHIRLAYPDFFSINLIWPGLIHELFHLVRHIEWRGSFDKECRLGFVRGMPFRWKEECIVWAKTVKVDPVNSAILLLLYAFIFVGFGLGLFFLTHAFR